MNRFFSILLLCLLLLVGCSSNKQELLFNSFSEKLVNEDYENLYLLLSSESQQSVSQEDFITKYKNIYSGIEATNIQLEMGEVDKENNLIPFNLSMDTKAGEMSFSSFELPFVKEEGELRIVWSEKLIFPMMENGDKVRVRTLSANRGSIFDRNGEAIAKDGTLITIGIHPSVFDQENRDSKIKELATILDINEETIIKKLNANKNPDHFVSIVDLLEESPKLASLQNRQNEGILTQAKQGRVYKNDESFGRLLGYIRPITEEELKNDEEGVYTTTSLIGKAGLEQVYESTLRGINGVEIYIERDGHKVETLAIKEAQHGSSITLSIDARLQKLTYDKMNGEKGSATAVNPTTGEILALVSSPSYNSNWFTTYMTKSDQQHRENIKYEDEKNRFASLYSPGSTFKLITAATGLETQTINPTEIKTINGSQWQPDSSWGNYNIRRINSQMNIDLRKAIKYSDNIYFAMSALKMGSDSLIQGANNFTIGEKLNVGYPINQSQISNSGTINSDILLADTGYGQGEIMVTTLNMALAYSALSNKGNIMNPTLVLNDNSSASVLKESVISAENLPILQDAFSAVIEESDGTGRLAKIDGVKLAGKTGTAEIKSSQGETGHENGWFVATDLDSSKVSIAVVVEDVQEGLGTLGVVSIVHDILTDYLK
ncbi:penicillin-binding transpeptidase domain-containing protein [Turicibacter sp. TJ11]|uniref:penicillin-binding transpeptidase domain-containing protein n=1 Tax=Turicibacter sp. TJ11 TaxID=2806443 RepID=UPI001F428762|nr:penicillin-binding transpeptidase domain-containing protein [Turicibacter sp. TJ11]